MIASTPSFLSSIVAILHPRSTTHAIIGHPVRWLPEWNSWLNWRIELILGRQHQHLFCINGFLPVSKLNAMTRQRGAEGTRVPIAASASQYFEHYQLYFRVLSS